ncbi:MAG: cytochrome ubiquinol oxidase subunit I [Dysgonamonadaceae bacterium]|jgi:cytochrome d ubiquinol oxidase subunit I|nr:cytochrome ubiquinol oxidase subunit I [Dysgonamonadaceae bacterium]
MIENLDSFLVDWSRAQFAMTAIYHWLFVPLTLGLGLIMSIMETIYYKTGNVFWKETAKFWMKLFGINFAVGVATGLILEFEFGTNWSNYSWFVGDIFGAPLAIEGVIAFFMEATFIAVMFFGWNKVSRGMHLTSTWLTFVGTAISALWILVANAWMQYPVGMKFNPDTVRNEMYDFWAVATSPVAINKFFHTVLSGLMLGGSFVMGVSAWFLLKERHRKFAVSSMKIGAATGLVSALLLLVTGDSSSKNVAKYQPMKLAAMEGLYNGSDGVSLVGLGVLKPCVENVTDNDDAFYFKIAFPKMLSWLATGDANAYVPGINDLLKGGYRTDDGEALSAEEKIRRGKVAIKALSDYRVATKEGNGEAANAAKTSMESNFKYFGYGYINQPKDLIPPVQLTFYSFHVMVILGAYFILLFLVICWFGWKDNLNKRWLHVVSLWSIPLAYIAGQAGWVVAEVGRQPWAIQDILPVTAAISKLPTTSVVLTFFLFLILFAIMLVAEIRIMVKAIKKGPNSVVDENK